MRKATGYRPGAVLPFGPRTDLRVVADPRAFSPTVVYCGGGGTTTTLKIRSDYLRALVRLIVAPVRAG